MDKAMFFKVWVSMASHSFLTFSRGIRQLRPFSRSLRHTVLASTSENQNVKTYSPYPLAQIMTHRNHWSRTALGQSSNDSFCTTQATVSSRARSKLEVVPNQQLSQLSLAVRIFGTGDTMQKQKHPYHSFWKDVLGCRESSSPRLEGLSQPIAEIRKVEALFEQTNEHNCSNKTNVSAYCLLFVCFVFFCQGL